MQTTPSIERRRAPREPGKGEPPRARLVSLIVGTYREMPGLKLHLSQAARLFGLRDVTCRVVLDDLVRDGLLRRSPDGQYSGTGSSRDNAIAANKAIQIIPPLSPSPV